MNRHYFSQILSSILLAMEAGCSQNSRAAGGQNQPQYCEGGVGIIQENGLCASTPGGGPCVYVTVSDALTHRPINDVSVWIERRLPMAAKDARSTTHNV